MHQPFQRALDAHGATVLRVCRAVLGHDDEAEDAWADTFLAALTAWPTLPADTVVEAWLVTVARRKAIDVLRARARQPLLLEQLPDVPFEGRPLHDPALWAAVDRLPERQRLAVACHYLGGLAYAEIANLHGGTADAARRAAADGVKNLRITLGDPR